MMMRSSPLSWQLPLLPLLLLLLFSTSTAAVADVNRNEKLDDSMHEPENSTNNNTTTKTEQQQMLLFALPNVQVQFLCDHDIRPGFNETKVFEEFYNARLPGDIRQTTFSSDVKISSMDDVPTSKWYYSSCNTSSTQILVTLDIDGIVHFNEETSLFHNETREEAKDTWKAFLDKELKPDVLENYFQHAVCKNIELFHALITHDTRHYHSSPESSQPQGSYQYHQNHELGMEHSLFLLCGGGDVLFYDKEGDDSAFMLFGLMVGIMMVAMIFSELQKFESRPHPATRRSSGTTSSQRLRSDYIPTHTQEFEMV